MISLCPNTEENTQHNFLLDNSGGTPQHLVCLQAIESLFTSSQRTPPKAHENLTGKPLDKNDQKNLGLQKTKRTQLGSGILSGMIWDGWCVTGKLRQEAIHRASEVVDIRDLGKVNSTQRQHLQLHRLHWPQKQTLAACLLLCCPIDCTVTCLIFQLWEIFGGKNKQIPDFVPANERSEKNLCNVQRPLQSPKEA